MSRIRSIKPDWLDDELMAMATSDARTLSVALLLLADDFGNGRASPVLLAGRVFPLKPLEVFSKALAELAAMRFVLLYEVNGQRYFAVRNWTKHQKVDKPGKPHVPGPPQSPSQHPTWVAGETPEKVIETPENFRESLGHGSDPSVESLAPDQDRDRDREGTVGGAPDLPVQPIVAVVTPDNTQHERRAGTSLLVRQFHAELLGALGTFPSQSHKTAQSCAALTEWAEQAPDPKRALQAAFLAFREDEWALEHRYPIAALANQTEKYHSIGVEMLADEAS